MIKGTYKDYIETLRGNTVDSIQKSLQLLLEDRCKSKCWVSEIPVIERILDRFDELTPLWVELNSKLSFNARYDFIDCVLGLIIFAKPDSFIEARQVAKELHAINTDIANTAGHLADLLSSQSEMSESSGFTSDIYYSIKDPINDAANTAQNYLFESYPKEKLNQLFGRYDLKYWPSLPQIIRAIADNANQADVYANNEITSVGTQSQRASSVDCIRAFYTALGNFTVHDSRMVEKVMTFPNPAIVGLLNIVYDWKDEEILSDEQLKNYKSRIKRQV
ncbi:hypothetical protein ACFO4O_15265 [Glaciecola siphonariae]|uniref:Uncharacterized protein n=1 Tax=Glaciecola siphonariae TaxID=521012 RepID=A0ABV9LYY3_9ALTE